MLVLLLRLRLLPFITGVQIERYSYFSAPHSAPLLCASLACSRALGPLVCGGGGGVPVRPFVSSLVSPV